MRLLKLKSFKIFQILFVSLLMCGSHSAYSQSKFVGGYEATGGSGDLWVLLQNGDMQVLFGLFASLRWEALIGLYDSSTNTTKFDSVIGLQDGYEVVVTAYWYNSPRTDKITGELRITECKYHNGQCSGIRNNSLVAFLSKVFDS